MECVYFNDDDEEEGVSEWYWLCLEEPKHMIEQIIKQRFTEDIYTAGRGKANFLLALPTGLGLLPEPPVF